MPELVFLRRGEELLRVALDRSRLVLGRGEASDVVIPHPEVSPYQAALLFDGRELVVQDLSGQGTVVSGAKTQRASLPVGADIELGQWHAVLRAPRASEELSRPERWCTRGIGTVRVFPSEAETSATASMSPQVNQRLEPRRQAPSQCIVGADPSIRQLAAFIERVASSRVLVSIFGEPGSGRELVARAIHTRSFNSARPFIRVNCRRIRNDLLEGELFGHSSGPAFEAGRHAGAFGEAAGGTLFLDEVGELPLELQAKFVRTLESQNARSAESQRGRIVVATNRDLLSMMRAGVFREDLYDLLCLAPLVLPPLRRRRGDVPSLAEHFVNCFAPQGQVVSLAPNALGKLAQYGWPGNIHELQNVIRRALLLRKSQQIEATDLSFDPEPCTEARLPAGEFIPGLTLDQMLRQREREIVESALRRFDNNRERVARELGVARSTLFKRLKDWGLTKHWPPPPAVSPLA